MEKLLKGVQTGILGWGLHWCPGQRTLEIDDFLGHFLFRQNFRFKTPETFRAEWKGFPAKEPSLHCAPVTITCLKTVLATFWIFCLVELPSRNSCFRFLLEETWRFTWKSPKRSSIGLAARADVILNDKIGNEKKKRNCPWTTPDGKHWKWRRMFF